MTSNEASAIYFPEKKLTVICAAWQSNLIDWEQEGLFSKRSLSWGIGAEYWIGFSEQKLVSQMSKLAVKSFPTTVVRSGILQNAWKEWMYMYEKKDPILNAYEL